MSIKPSLTQMPFYPQPITPAQMEALGKQEAALAESIRDGTFGKPLVRPEDLRVMVYHSEHRNPYSQTVNGIPRFVEVTHLPTGLQAMCGCYRSQESNRKVAVAMLERGLKELNWKP